jgi:hypothetical protein
MSVANSRKVPAPWVEGYLTRIDTHLAHLIAGHDPLGHLFAIERLARVARSEWWETQRQPDGGKPRP